MDFTETQYKFNLAIDVIYYLISLLLKDRSNKIEMVDQIIDKWDARIDRSFRILKIEASRKMASEEDMPVDVASILSSTKDLHVTILKREFKTQLKSLLVAAIMKEMEKKA